MTADCAFPSCQLRSISIPALARKPRNAPAGYARGSAGTVNRAVVALEQHFGDAGRPAEVAVDLKRRVEIPQIRKVDVASSA